MGRGDALSPAGYIEHCAYIASWQPGFIVTTTQGSWVPICHCRNDDIAPQAKCNRYRRNAQSKQRVFELTDDEVFTLFSQCCHYCKGEPKRTSGMDRVDSSHGYKNPNVVSCCTTCNRVKYRYSVDAFIQRCVAIALNHNMLIKSIQ